MTTKSNLDKAVICVIGLGYVGLPLAEAFARTMKVIGYDINGRRTAELSKNNKNRALIFTDNAAEISGADFIIICVPTPVTEFKEPDLSYVIGAARTIGRHIKKGAVVVLESTVYPGVTEDIVGPVIEKETGLKYGRDFKLGYSPERINPGDDEHAIGKVTKVVAGMDEDTSRLLAQLYGKITPHVFQAKNIKTAEAAKVIENIQRDLNIALMNEFSLIFKKMGLSTGDVLEAAATKWNFQRYRPGLVGGHCIPVDPYYLVYKARELDYHPQVILAGRAINDHMPQYVAEMAIKSLNAAGKVIKGARVLIAGLTYKEDVPDIRETPVKGIIKGLEEYGVNIYGYDPLLNNADEEFGIKIISSLQGIKFDAVILAVVHKAMHDITVEKLRAIMGASPILIDVRGFFADKDLAAKGFYYRTL
jgi:UDP-N-acetyl-D-galactosamine dehydrogenase